MRLLDFVEQQYAVRMLGDRFGEQAALVESDIAGRRADQPRHRVPLHVLGHVEAHQLHTKRERELPGDLGLADPSGAREQEGANGLTLVAQPRARHLDRGRERFDRAVLAVDHELQVALQVAQHVPVAARDRLRRDAGDPRHDILDVRHGHRRFALGLRLQPQARTRLVDHVDGLVGQVTIVDVARRQLRRRGQRLILVADAVVLLEARAQPTQDLDGFGNRRLDDIDLLEAARERMVLLEDAAVLLVGRRADAAQLAVRQCGLDQVRGVHDATRGGARADHGVDLVNEQDGARQLLDFGQHGLQALFEVTAVLGARDQRAQVECVDRAASEHARHLAFDDQPREALHQRRLADTRLPDVERVVLAAPAQDFDGPLDLELAAYQRVDAAFLGELVQIGGVLLERRAALGLAFCLGGRRILAAPLAFLARF